jgi:diguanylate cyclase (GGDEF)-like protein
MRVKISKTEFEIENNQKIKLTISIGAAKIKNYASIEDAISLADINLYKAKETGRNKLIK